MRKLNEEDILECLLKRADYPIKIKELTSKLGLRASDKTWLRRTVKNLVRKGHIVQLKGRRYIHPKKMQVYSGTIKRHPDGYGFVIADSGKEKDLFVNKTSFGNAIHGDRVLVRVDDKKWNGRKRGSVLKILERGKKQLIGRFEKALRLNYVKPDNPRLPDEIIIPDGETKGAKNGQVVLAEITQYPEGKNRFIYGKIKRVLGYPGEEEVEFLSTVYNFDIPFEFSKEALAEAKRIKKTIDERAASGRVDLRGRLIFTIDGKDAKDFDDAISLESTGDGFTLGVHIADVAHYVKKGSPIDKDAYKRGTSVYFPDRAIPMLPFELSNNICSLKPEEDRLTISVEIHYDNKGDIKSFSIFESIIKSKYRMTYEDVFEIITNRNQGLIGKYKAVVPTLRKMKALAEKLHSKRKKRKGLDFDLPEPEVILNEKGELQGIIKKEPNEAHNLIEEFMLQANEIVAKLLTREGIDTLYRIHDEPDPDALQELEKFLLSVGVQSKIKGDPSSWLTDIIKRSENHRLKHIISQMILRTLKKAIYSVENKGHFGLALDTYTHFTSPIRRYPDLVIHRKLKELLSESGHIRHPFSYIDLTEDAKPAQKTTATKNGGLVKTAEHTTMCEIRADEAQWDIIALKRAQFMLDKIGNDYEGIIISIHPFGFFVELIDFFVEGLVPVTSLEDDYYIFNETNKSLTGKTTHRKFELGNIVNVKVVAVDIQRRATTFVIPDLLLPRQPRKRSRRGMAKKNRKR